MGKVSEDSCENYPFEDYHWKSGVTNRVPTSKLFSFSNNSADQNINLKLSPASPQNEK